MDGIPQVKIRLLVLGLYEGIALGPYEGLGKIEPLF